MLYRPDYLKPNDTIAILSTARKVSVEEIQPAIDLLKSWGLQVRLGETIGAEENQYAGSDALRARDLQRALDDTSVKAILMARGGYGTIRIMEQINFRGFCDNPKWICGFSDYTVLHSYINNYLGIQTIHSPMPITFPTNTASAVLSLKQALFGEKITYQVPTHTLNRIGNTSGEIIGGNLSLLYALLGNKSGFSPQGKILFIEDLDEYLYHVDRMMMALKLSGKLKGLKGLIVGGMTDMKDNTVPFGKTAEEIILEHCADTDYPICFGFPAGHISNNQSLYLGREANLSVGKSAVSFNYL